MKFYQSGIRRAELTGRPDSDLKGTLRHVASLEGDVFVYEAYEVLILSSTQDFPLRTGVHSLDT